MTRAIDGMSAAARVLETPVISGNVSLYNESFGAAIYPTPVVGMVGLLEGREPTPSAFQAAGDVVGVLGPWTVTPNTLGGSTYLATIQATKAGRPPQLDLEVERAVQQTTLAASAAGLLRSAHDCSDGGLAVALAECCVWSGLGMRGELQLPEHLSNDLLAATALLFGEAPSRIVLSATPENWDALSDLAAEHGMLMTRLGVVGGERLTFPPLLDCAVDELYTTWRQGFRQAEETPEAEQAHVRTDRIE
jgi:phosphoribosylformylglycinamidine synthase subunit PurL